MRGGRALAPSVSSPIGNQSTYWFVLLLCPHYVLSTRLGSEILLGKNG